MYRTFLLGCLLFTAIAAYAQKGLTELPVTIKDGWFTAKTIAFDQFQTTSRKNSITDTAASFIKAPSNPFNFELTGTDNRKQQVQVLSTPQVAFSGRTLPAFLSNMPATAVFTYILIRSTPDTVAEMILKNATYLELNENKQAGVLRTAHGEIKITANNDFGTKNSYEHIRYEFVYKRKIIAAVIADEKPRLWVNEAELPQEQRPVIMAAVAALLLR